MTYSGTNTIPTKVTGIERIKTTMNKLDHKTLEFVDVPIGKTLFSE